MSSGQGPIVSVDDRRLISLSSNDYLGLTHHPRLRAAALEAVRDFGAGSGAVRTIAGTMTLHEELERDLAEFKGVAATLTFQSGFTANTGVIPTITGEQDLIVCDELNHASIIDGMRLSKAPRKIYRHADADHLRAILDDAVEKGRDGTGQPYRLILVVTDGVFSMDGDIAPLPGIVEAAEIGQRRGVRRRRPRLGRARPRRPRVGRPLRAPRPGRDPGRHAQQGRRRARWLRRGLAGPARHPRPAGSARSSSRPRTRRPSAAACREAIRVMQEEPELHERLWANTRRFKAELTRLGFDTGRSETPITPVMMGDPDTAGRFSAAPVRGGRLRPAGRLPDGRHRQGADPDDRDRRPRRRPARPGARGVRHGRPRARPDRRVTDPGPGSARPRRSLPLDPPPPPASAALASRRATCRSTPTSTPISRPTATSRSTPTPRRRSSAGSPRSRSPTTSTSSRACRRTRSPRSPSASAIVREAAERWAPHGVAIRFGVEISYEPRPRGRHPRPPRPAPVRLRDRQRPRLLGLAVPRRSGSPRGRPAGRWPRSSAPYFDEVLRGDPVRACSTRSATSTSSSATSCPHVTPARPGGRARAVRAAPRRPRRDGHGARGQHERAAPGPGRDVPGRADRGSLRGARRHRRRRPGPMPTESGAFTAGLEAGYGVVAAAGFEQLAFRRGGSRVARDPAGSLSHPGQVWTGPTPNEARQSVVMTIDDAAIERLVAEARDGDAWAFGMIFDHYHDPIYPVHRQPRPSPVGRGGPDAARLRQGPGSAAALRVAGHSRSGAGCSGWPGTRSSTTSGRATSMPIWTRSSSGPTGIRRPDELAAVRQELEAVAAALACLTDEQREAIELRFFAGLSAREAAVAMGKPGRNGPRAPVPGDRRAAAPARASISTAASGGISGWRMAPEDHPMDEHAMTLSDPGAFLVERRLDGYARARLSPDQPPMARIALAGDAGGAAAPRSRPPGEHRPRRGGRAHTSATRATRRPSGGPRPRCGARPRGDGRLARCGGAGWRALRDAPLDRGRDAAVRRLRTNDRRARTAGVAPGRAASRPRSP